MNNNKMKDNYKILLIFKMINNKKSTIITLKTINKNQNQKQQQDNNKIN